MKTADVKKLKKGDKIIHNRYGNCVVDQVMMCFENIFGVVIIPETVNGRALLAGDSNTSIEKYLEDSIRQIKLPDKPEKYR